MATDTFTNTSGGAWDIATNWSLGTVPGTLDDVVINGPPTTTLTVTIGSGDPLYTVASLTESTTNPSLGLNLSVAGRLSVTGTTSLSSSNISVGSGGSVVLNAVTMSTSSQINEFGSGGTLSIQTVTGIGSSGGSLGLSAGNNSIGSISGTVSVSISNTASATVGSTAGNGFFGLNNGRLNLQSSATTLSDTISISGPNSIVDLQSIAYQAGESYSTALVSSNIFSTYSVTLKSSSGQTLYTFQKVTSISSQSAPVLTLVSDGANGTLVTIACYAAATRIAVPGGETPASGLAIGDLVLNAAGATRPVKWIGRRSYAGRFLKANPAAMPIRFAAGALGNGLPRRDLLVSPEHAMFIDGVLIPARHLVNGTTIRPARDVASIEYIHIELETHDVILAEGAPSETFVDDDSRAIFHNAHEFAALYPGQPPIAPIYCAPRIEHGQHLATIRQAINHRAAA